MKRGIYWLMIGLVPLLAGCECVQDNTLTGRLWNEDFVLNHHEPAPHPNLKAFAKADGKDVLVEYDETREKDYKIHRRAFFLLANKEKLEAGKKPRFVKLRLADNLQPVPVYGGTDAVSTKMTAMWIMLSPDEKRVALFFGDAEAANLNLPVYRSWGTKFNRVMLTPVALAGDTAVVGGLLALLAVYLYASGSQ
jgi:hypothetical protein